VRTPPVEVRPSDKIEHVLSLTREQDREKTKDDAGYGHKQGRKGEVPGERRQFRLALHETAQTYVRGIEEWIEGVVLRGVYDHGFRHSGILLA
jgi:hypothetical protein